MPLRRLTCRAAVQFRCRAARAVSHRVWPQLRKPRGHKFDTGIAFDASEIGLFGSTADTASMVAQKTFTLVSKAAADTINVTYQIIAGTA